jgi:hypothetical protein
MKMFGEMEVKLHEFSTSTVDGSECLALRPGGFDPEKDLPVPIVQKVGWAPERVLATFDMCS